MRAQQGCIQTATGLDFDEGDDLFIAPGLAADHGGLDNIAVGVQRRLDFRRVDVEAGADDEFFGPADDEEIAIRPPLAQIAGPKPAIIAEDSTGCCLVAVVTEHLVRASDENFANGAIGYLSSVARDEAHVDARQGKTD